MSAPTKEYLDYYNWSCNAFDVDKKLKKLSRKYGPLGETIYRRMLDLIYSNSYYLEADLEDAAMMVVDKIGSKWVSDEKCAEVLVYCSEIGLFEHSLVKSKVWTAVGIQQRYFSIMIQLRRKIDVSQKKYLLVDIPLNSQTIDHSSEETKINDEETKINDEETQVNTTKKKRKEKKVNNSYIYSLFENSFARPLTQIEMQLIYKALNIFGPEMVEYSLTIAVENNAINMNYIKAIWNNWLTNNIKTVEQAKQRKQVRKSIRKPIRKAVEPVYSTEQGDPMSEDELAELKRKLEEIDG